MTNKRLQLKMLPMIQGLHYYRFTNFKRNGARFSGKTVEKVLAAKERLNYQPDYFAQRMVMKKRRRRRSYLTLPIHFRAIDSRN